jgi:hypothetical protein
VNDFMIIALSVIVAMAWFWHEKPGLKRTLARTWPVSRGKTGAKPGITTPL